MHQVLHVSSESLSLTKGPHDEVGMLVMFVGDWHTWNRFCKFANTKVHDDCQLAVSLSDS